MAGAKDIHRVKFGIKYNRINAQATLVHSSKPNWSFLKWGFSLVKLIDFIAWRLTGTIINKCHNN